VDLNLRVRGRTLRIIGEAVPLNHVDLLGVESVDVSSAGAVPGAPCHDCR
jgi:hypothetical protein